MSSSTSSRSAGLSRDKDIVQLPVPIKRQRPLVEREAAHRFSAQRDV